MMLFAVPFSRRVRKAQLNDVSQHNVTSLLWTQFRGIAKQHNDDPFEEHCAYICLGVHCSICIIGAATASPSLFKSKTNVPGLYWLILSGADGYIFCVKEIQDNMGTAKVTALLFATLKRFELRYACA